MSEEEKKAGNKIIGEFMGKNFKDPLNYMYDNSWNDLMPSIKKMKDYLQNMERPSKNHCCKGDLLEVDVQCALWEIDIEKTFAAFVILVSWYNQQKKV